MLSLDIILYLSKKKAKATGGISWWYMSQVPVLQSPSQYYTLVFSHTFLHRAPDNKNKGPRLEQNRKYCTVGEICA